MRRRDCDSLRIVDLWSFRSTKSRKRYIIEVEGFEHQFYGIKFYWKGVEKSNLRDSLLTYDYEPRRIIRTCIEVMLDYYRKNTSVSFGFVAAPDLETDIKGKKKANNQPGSRRFRFYQRMMVSLFGPDTFYQAADTSNTIYLMINRKQLSAGAITLKEIENLLNSTYEGGFTLNE